MRIAFINVTYDQGSTGKIVKALADSCRNAGHSVLVLYGRGPKQKDATRIASSWENNVDGLLSRLFDNQGFNSKIPTKRAIRLLKDFNPDIINIHNLHGYFFNLPLFFDYLDKDFRGRVIWTLHDCWALTGHCSHFLEARCDKWRTGCFDCPIVHHYPKSWGADRSRINWGLKRACYLKMLKNRKLLLVTPSEWLSTVVSFSMLKDFNTQVINNGIDIALAKEQAESKKKRGDIKIVLGVAQKWESGKGLDVIISLANSLPNTFQIRLIGDVRMNKEKLPNNVIACGFVSNKSALYREFASADVFVNPSKEDTYPTVNLEAICCGTPVVAFDIGGMKETIKSERYGVVVRSIEDLVSEIVMRASKQTGPINYDLYDSNRMCAAYLDLFQLSLAK